MSKAFKTASSLGAAALVLSGAAMAAAPMADGFDKWDVTGGTITPTTAGGVGDNCPATWTCSAAVTGDGFYQRQISDGSGNDYFQTIITDKGVSGSPGALTFSDESYVKTGNVGGLADKSQILESTTTGGVTEDFIASTELATGWANGTGDPADDVTRIYQRISAVNGTTTTGGEDFYSDFWLDQVGNQGSTGRHMRIAGSVDIVEQDGATAASVQDFVLVDLTGTGFVAAGGTADLGADGSITWVAGDNIKAIWVGQDMSNVAGVAQEFGFTSYEDLTGTTGLINTFALTGSSSAAPVGWDTAVWGEYDPAAAGPF